MMEYPDMDQKNENNKTRLLKVFEKKKILKEYIFIIMLIIMVYLLITIFLS